MMIKANAKINRYLKVKGLRDDGYHELESLMIPIDLYDEIQISPNEFDSCVCDGLELSEEKNLAYKALKLIKDKFLINECVKLTIKKKIPVCSGLGGGSSDAAFTLKGLNEYWNLGLNNEELCNLALNIGSDVPFFINNKPAIVAGRGEKIKITEYDDICGVLVYDGYEFSTKTVFDKYDSLEKVVKEKETANDLEKAIENEFIFDIKKRLLNLECTDAAMTGSGSCVFGICESLEKANEVFGKIKDDYKFVYVFKNIKENKN